MFWTGRFDTWRWNLKFCGCTFGATKCLGQTVQLEILQENTGTGPGCTSEIPQSLKSTIGTWKDQDLHYNYKKLTCRFRTYLSRKGTPHRSHFTLFGCLFFFLGSSTTSSGSPDKPPDKFSLLHNLWKEVKPIITSGIWPRVRDRALCAPVFLSSLPPQTGLCAPPPAHRSFASPKK
jgi:hypothetical protein